MTSRSKPSPNRRRLRLRLHLTDKTGPLFKPRVQQLRPAEEAEAADVVPVGTQNVPRQTAASRRARDLTITMTTNSKRTEFCFLCG